MSLPQQLTLGLMQVQWAQQLDPLISAPITQGLAISSVLLNAGVPKTIPTTLSRMQLGWFLTDNLANATVWRTQPFNANNLTLQASADTTISLWVF